MPSIHFSPFRSIFRNWLAAQRVTGVQGSSGALLAAVHLPLCWCLVHRCGYLGAAIATSVGNVLRMLWVIFKQLGLCGTIFPWLPNMACSIVYHIAHWSEDAACNYVHKLVHKVRNITS